MGSTAPRGWFLLEHRYYQRTIVYTDLTWSLSSTFLSQCLAAFAPCGGPVAVVPEYGWALSGAACSVYTLAGRLLKQYQRIREYTSTPMRTVAIGWSRRDVLTLVYDDGGVVRLRIGALNDISKVHRLTGDGDNRQHIYDATVLSSGDVVARGVSGDIFRLTADDAVVVDSVKIKPPPLDAADSFNRTSIIGIAPNRSSYGDIETLVVSFGGALFKITSSGAHQLSSIERISQLAISANGKFMAFVVADTSTIVVSNMDLSDIRVRIDLGRKLADTIPGASREPKRIMWVGSDCVAAFYDSAIILIGPNEKVAVIDLDNDNEFSADQVLLKTEADGLRILSASKLEFLQCVNPSVASVFSDEKHPAFKLLRGSGARMHDFRLTLDGRSVDPLTRYELISQLRDINLLRDAARTCASAALLVEDPVEQKALLRATAYAHRFNGVLHKKTDEEDDKLSSKASDSFDPKTSRKHVRRKQRDEDIVPSAITSLRIINAVRSRSIGIPLTKLQFDTLGETALISRLSMYGEHSTAIKLAFYTDESTSHVLEKWAVAAIQNNPKLPDDVLSQRIVDRFEAVEKQAAEQSSSSSTATTAASSIRALPYVCAAEAAFALKRKNCADALLQKEHRPAPKVAMYLKMGREGHAVTAAVASSNPELVLEVLGKVARRSTRSETVRDTARLFLSLKPVIRNRAIDLFANHLRQSEDYEMTRLIYLETGRLREAALLEIALANGKENDEERLGMLENIVGSYRGMQRRACDFEISSALHAATVARCAKEVEKRAGLPRGSLSRTNDSELLRRAIHGIRDASKRQNMIDILRNELKIPERRFFWVCLDAMADASDFESIEKLSQRHGSKAPPIGYMAFVDACLRVKEEDEAKKYADRIKDLRIKARALARCGYGKEATDLAQRLRNPQLQEEIAELVSLHANSYVSQK